MNPTLSRRSFGAALSASVLGLGLPGGRQLLAANGSNARARVLHLLLRSRQEIFRGQAQAIPVQVPVQWPVAETAIVICDMWDRHWCRGSGVRIKALAPKIGRVVGEARKAGIQIIHAPSDTMGFYKDYPQRKRIEGIARVEPPASKELSGPPLPYDPNGTCETPDTFYQAWTREDPAIGIGAHDVISDQGPEIYSFLKERGIRNLLITGVHTNSCVLDRPFGIKQMTAWGMRCALVRDLTDAGSNPRESPFVSRDRATEMVVEYIETYWCPTLSSAELIAACKK